MKRITVPELRHIADELRSIKDRKIENIYQTDDEIRFVIDGKELLFFPSSLHLTKPPKKRDITSFALILRKYIRNKLIGDISSKNLSVELVINSNKIILELFPKFNCILCDNSYKIIMPMKFYKETRPGEKYEFPDGPDFRNKERFRKFLSKKYPTALLLRDYFGKYVKVTKEIGERLGKQLKENERKKILEGVRSLISEEKNPQVVYRGRKIIDAVPFDITAYKNLKKKYFETFNEALDFFFAKTKGK